MSNIKGSEVSVKEYAEQRGKTVQAVYQQIKRKENSVALNGHIVFHRQGNKDVMYLDETAVSILDKSSGSAPVVIIQTKSEELLIEANKQLESLKFEYMKLQGRYELLQEQLHEQEHKLLVIDSKNKEIELLEGFIQDAKQEIEVQKAQNGILKTERDEAIERALLSDKNAQTASESLTDALKTIDRLNNRTLFQRIFNK